MSDDNKYGSTILNNFLRLKCIDDLDIPENIIIKCRNLYNSLGKTKIYNALNDYLYESKYWDKPHINKTLRYLYIYRLAYIQSECALNNINFIYKPIPEFDNGENKCPFCGKDLNIIYSAPKDTDGGIYNYDENPDGTIPEGKDRIISGKYCGNPNCPANTKYEFNGRWAFRDMNATVPYVKSDENGTGTISKNGFILDDYAYNLIYTNNDSTTHPQSILTMEDRGAGIGIPRTHRFDFEFRFSTVEKHREVYSEICLETLTSILYKILDLGISSIASVEELDAINEIISELSIEDRLEVSTLIKDFSEYSKIDESDAKDLIKHTLETKISELHEKYKLPLAFMSVMFYVMISSSHTVFLTDKNNKIYVKDLYGRNVYYTTDITSLLPIATMDSKIKDMILTEDIPITSNGSVSITDKYELFISESMEIKVWSTMFSKFLDKDSCKLVDKSIAPINSYSRVKSYTILGSKSCIVFSSRNQIHIFAFNEELSGKWIKSIDFNALSDITDFDISIDNKLVAISNSNLAEYDLENNRFTSLESSNDLNFVDYESKTETDNSYERDDYSELKFSDGENVIDRSHIPTNLRMFDKVHYLKPLKIDENNVLEFIVVTDDKSNVQIIRRDSYGEFHTHIVIKLGLNNSRVVSFIEFESNSRLYLFCENGLVCELYPYEFGFRIVPNTISKMHENEKVIGVEKIFNEIISVTTSRSDDKSIFVVYDKHLISSGVSTIIDTSSINVEKGNFTNYSEVSVSHNNFEVYSRYAIIHGMYESLFKMLSQI